MVWVINATPRPLYPRERDPYPFYRRLVRAQGHSGRARKISPPPGLDPRAVPSPLFTKNNRYVNRRIQRFQSLFWYFAVHKSCDIITFIFLVAIVSLNLLNGLAMSDTYAIRRNAETLSLVARVRLILKTEASVRALQRCMTCSVEETKEMCTLYPNRRNKIGSTEFRHLLSIITKKRQPNKKWGSTVIQDKWAALHCDMTNWRKD